MIRNLNPKIWSAAAVATLALISLLVWMLYSNVAEWTKAEREMRHARTAIRSVESLYSQTLASESAVRTYLATGRAEALENFDRATSVMQREANFMRQLARNRPIYAGGAGRLSDLVSARVASYNRSILSRRARRLSESELTTITRAGTRITSDIRSESRAMLELVRAELGLLDINSAARTQQRNRVLIAIFTVLLIFLLGAIAAFLRGERSRRQTEIELADSNSRLKSVLDSATQFSIISTDLSGRITLFSAGAEKLLGYRAEELLGSTPDRIHVREEVDTRGRELSNELGKKVEGFDVFVELARQGGHETREWTYVRKDGGQVPVELVVTGVRAQNGELVGFLGLATDISSRKKAQMQMRKLSAAIKSSPTSIVITDREGLIEYSNPKILELTGYSERELLGHNPRILASGKTPKSIYEEMWATILDGREWHGEFLNKKKNGDLFWEYASISPVKDPQGRITNFVAVKMDITDQKLAQREMEKAKDAAVELARLKSEFLANMSHEIRTPMNAIIGMTGLLMGTQLSPRQRDYASTIATAGESLLDLINDILDFSKLESGKMLIETMDFDLRETVESTVELLAQRAQEKGIELEYLIGTGTPSFLRGDPGRLRQVLTNLIGNAIKFTNSGEVMLTVSPQEESAGRCRVKFSVRDTGIGIPEGAKKKLFQSFSQADASTTRKYGGTGLGLSISKRIVELMGGEIDVQSAEGKGSTFSFSIPFERSETQPPGPEPAELDGRRALVVDDNAASREIVSHYLSEWRMRPETASSAPDGLKALRAAAAAGRPFDAAVIDMQMPGMDGMMLAREIHTDKTLTGLPVIMLTSLGQEFSAEQRNEAGLAGYMHKPLRPSALLDALNTIFAQKATSPVTSAAPADPGSRSFFRVLVAEDNAVNQKVALHQLEKLGYEADVAANGLEAVAALKKHPYDLVLMDCQMPEMDGFEATAEIRRLEADQQRRTPIVAMTANALQGDQERCMAAGMDGYISKPVRIEKLAETLKQWDTSIDQFTVRELKELGGDDSAFIAELADTYLSDLPGRAEDIRAAYRAGSPEELRLAAHALKGSSANLGARRLQKICLLLEEAGRTGSMEGTAELMEALEKALPETEAAVKALAGQKESGT